MVKRKPANKLVRGNKMPGAAAVARRATRRRRMKTVPKKTATTQNAMLRVGGGTNYVSSTNLKK